ncbi:MAG: hypothetical protein HQM11_16685 [SAR324 cluster bacterium]|nr:hypothetical protein [SAR324 cluster bacterium]
MKMIFLKTGYVSCLLFLMIAQVQASTLTIRSEASYELGPVLEILEDPTNTMTFAEVRNESNASRFVKNEKPVPNYGYSKSAFWVRFSLTNAGNAPHEWLLELGYPLIDHVDVYFEHADGNYEMFKGGDQIPFYDRKVIYRNHVFPLKIMADYTHHFYIRVVNSGNVQIPLTLWSPIAFSEKINKEVYGLGFYYGIMFVMAFYNLFIFISVRDSSYFYYVMYILGLSLLGMAMNGLAYEYLWPDSPWLANNGLAFGLNLTLLFLTLFAKQYLHTAHYLPRTNKMLISMTVWCVLLILLQPIIGYALSIRIGVLTVVLLIITSMTAGVLSLKKGYTPARYYLLAWTTFFLGAFLAALREFGVVPVMFLTTYGFQVGAAIEVTLLSLGLADRINTYRKEKFLAQRKALDLQKEYNEGLEAKVEQRTHELNEKKNELEDSLAIQTALSQQLIESSLALDTSHKNLEQQNLQLQASNRKLEDLSSIKETLMVNLNVLEKTHLQALKEIHETLAEQKNAENQQQLQSALKEVYQIEELLRPISSLYQHEQAIQNRRVLLASTNKKQQIIDKLALGGTGLELDIASTVEKGRELLDQQTYDIVCFDTELIELAQIAKDHSETVQTVFMTSDDAPIYLPLLRKYPFISNIVSRNDEDRSFTLKNITTTVSKLISHDWFGLEKYLNWGVDVKAHPVVSSETRSELVQHMAAYLNKLGVRRNLLSKCEMVAEELLMNSIYDAPTDVNGKAIYNHLSRTIPIELKPNEYATFRYACDGVLLAISVEDPFGAFGRTTVLDYLESCYEGRAGSLNKEKGGAGRGLFQIMETSDLVVFNVKPGVRTEVIAILNIDPDHAKTEKTTSFHYFFG